MYIYTYICAYIGMNPWIAVYIEVVNKVKQEHITHHCVSYII